MTDRPDTLAQTIRKSLSGVGRIEAYNALNDLLRLLEQRTQERDYAWDEIKQLESRAELPDECPFCGASGEDMQALREDNSV